MYLTIGNHMRIKTVTPTQLSLSMATFMTLSLCTFGHGTIAAQEPQMASMGDCRLESGDVIQDCFIGYHTAGTLNHDSSNAVLFPTWFGGKSERILGLLGARGMIDTTENYVIVVDAFGNGVSSSPSNSTHQARSAFPNVSIRDMVIQQHRLLTETLEISSLKAVVGISMGGMQAFEWAVLFPGFAEKVVPVVGSPRLAVYDVVLWETYLATLDWFLECQCQPPAALQQGLGFLSGGPVFHARVSPRDSLTSILDRLSTATLDEDRSFDLSMQLRAMIGHDVSETTGGSMESAVANTTAELFVVVGLLDHVVTPGPALDFARALGAPTLELPDDCGHRAPWCGEETTEIFSTAVREFLGR
jgi:homoserine O-acetyltransferase